MDSGRLGAPFLGFGRNAGKTEENLLMAIATATQQPIRAPRERARKPDCDEQRVRVGGIGGMYRHNRNLHARNELFRLRYV